MKRCLLFFLAVAIVALPSLPLFAQSVPEIAYDSAPNLLKLPTDVFMGEAAGVAQNSKGHMFVFTRSGETQLFEFDQEGNFVREISPRNYAFAFAHTVRVDPQDNVWAVDEGAKFTRWNWTAGFSGNLGAAGNSRKRLWRCTKSTAGTKMKS